MRALSKAISGSVRELRRLQLPRFDRIEEQLLATVAWRRLSNLQLLTTSQSPSDFIRKCPASRDKFGVHLTGFRRVADFLALLSAGKQSLSIFAHNNANCMELGAQSCYLSTTTQLVSNVSVQPAYCWPWESLQVMQLNGLVPSQLCYFVHSLAHCGLSLQLRVLRLSIIMSPLHIARETGGPELSSTQTQLFSDLTCVLTRAKSSLKQVRLDLWRALTDKGDLDPKGNSKVSRAFAGFLTALTSLPRGELLDFRAAQGFLVAIDWNELQTQIANLSSKTE